MNTLAATEMPTPPGTPAHHGGIELVWPVEDQSEAAGMARRGVLLCTAGQVVARALPSVANAAASAGTALKLGAGVCWDDALSAYVARWDGHVRLVQNKLEVLETLEWADPLDAANGPFHFAGDMILRRGVLDLAVVHGSRDITVQDCIEAADVQAGRDLTVQRGVCGKEKGLVRAGGRLAARFLSNARVIAGGDVVIENEIDNSLVQCGGTLRVDRGTILSGHVCAIAGIHCHTAGSPSGVRTILELGVSPEQQAEIRRATEASAVNRQKARDIRTAVEPLMARQKTLTAAQKEKATELLFLADELETQAEEMAKRLAVLKRPADEALTGTMHIASTLHPGVIFRYPTHQARAGDCLRGPITVKLVHDGTQPMIVALDDHRGTKITLQPVEQRSSPAASIASPAK